MNEVGWATRGRNLFAVRASNAHDSGCGFENPGVVGLPGNSHARREVGGTDEEIDVGDCGELIDAIERLDRLDLRKQGKFRCSPYSIAPDMLSTMPYFKAREPLHNPRSPSGKYFA